jgi:tetratricopeptide (TPR) repeat protein
MKISIRANCALPLFLLLGCSCVAVAQSGAPSVAQPNISIPVPAEPTADPLLVGKQALQHEQWSDAQKFFSDYLRDNPENVEARFDLGFAAFGLKQYDESEKVFKTIIANNPKAWVAHSNLSEVYAAQEKWTEFDAERKLLHKAKDTKEAGTDRIGNDVIDVLYVDGERYIVREFYPLEGRSHTRYRFMHFDKQAKVDHWTACESDDVDQISFANMHPDLAAQGKRSFSLDSYSAPVKQPNGQITQSQGLIKFYWEGEPTYETVRADVLGSLQHKVTPMATTTTNGAAPAAQQAPAPQK